MESIIQASNLVSIVTQLLTEFASYGRTPEGGVTRLAYTEVEKLAQDRLRELCMAAGLQVRVDAAGNLIARRSGTQDQAPAVAFGSHLDSVVQAGAFDGVLGVVAGLAVIHRLNERGIRTRHPLELIAFTGEESARFGVATVGSKAMVGTLNSKSLLQLHDADGVTLPQALATRGLAVDKLVDAKRDKGDLKAFIEMHIEQGPVLAAQGYQVGLVTAIAAPTRWQVEVEGQPGHSGTTRMPFRKDALTAAAEIVLAVERMARNATDAADVGTVGVLRVLPGSANTIPGRVEMVVEFRSGDARRKQELSEAFLQQVAVIRGQRGVAVRTRLLADESPVQLDPDILTVTTKLSRKRGISFLKMPSGAGHDSMNMARLCPTGMIFVPSQDGVSHQPQEYTKTQDIAVGVDLLYETVVQLAGRD